MRPLLLFLASTLAPLVMRLYFVTIRILDSPPSRDKLLHGRRGPRIYAMWHAQQLSMAWHYRGTGVTTLSSHHRDSEYIVRIIRKLGLTSVRGSTTRGGAKAVMALFDVLERGGEIIITPDGPRGPRDQTKEGVLYLAQKTGLPIWPTALGLSDYWELRSWDRFRIPKPFARGYAMWSEPITVPAEMTAEEHDAMLRKISAALDAVEAEGDARARLLARKRRQGR
jgi:lysophospholipid acyltransferase (LPLAT)-like uncharacterized protein